MLRKKHFGKKPFLTPQESEEFKLRIMLNEYGKACQKNPNFAGSFEGKMAFGQIQALKKTLGRI
jgi:hypothetical protein